MSKAEQWFVENYLDGDNIQNGQMLSSATCLEAIETYAKQECEALVKEMLLKSDWWGVGKGESIIAVEVSKIKALAQSKNLNI